MASPWGRLHAHGSTHDILGRSQFFLSAFGVSGVGYQGDIFVGHDDPAVASRETAHVTDVALRRDDKGIEFTLIED